MFPFAKPVFFAMKKKKAALVLHIMSVWVAWRSLSEKKNSPPCVREIWSICAALETRDDKRQLNIFGVVWEKAFGALSEMINVFDVPTGKESEKAI